MIHFKPKNRPPVPTLDLIFQKRPLLKEILGKYSEKPLAILAEDLFKDLPAPHPQRQAEFLDTVEEILEERLGTDVAEAVSDQLSKAFIGSSADHHGSLNWPLSVSANLLLSSGLGALKYVFVLSCASVTLSNEEYPRGLAFHSNTSAELQKLSLLPSNSHNSLVYNFRPFQKEEVEKVKKALREKVKIGIVSPNEAEKVLSVLSIFEREEILKAPSLCHQFTQVNFHLWRAIFEEKAESELIYLELEELSSRLLCKYHLGKNTVMDRLLFDTAAKGNLQKLTEAMERYNRQGNIATAHFWYVSPDKNYRHKLMLVDGNLQTEDGSISFSFTPEGIREGLEKKLLMPNLLLAYILLPLYYGFHCIGGFNQVHFIKAMTEIYKEFDPEAPSAKGLLYGYGLDLVQLDEDNSAYGIDLLLHGENTWSSMKTAFQTITLGEAFGASSQIIHDILLKEDL